MITVAFGNTNARPLSGPRATGLGGAKLLVGEPARRDEQRLVTEPEITAGGFIARMSTAGRTSGWRAARFITRVAADATQACGTRRIFNAFLPRVRPTPAWST